MSRDVFSNSVFPAWMRISLFGLSISVVGVVIGGLVRYSLQGNVSATAVVARLVAAAVYGFGLAFGVLFLLLTIAGVLYAVLRRRR